VRPWWAATLAAGVGIAALIAAAWRMSMAKKVFISYDHSEDSNYKQMLRAWSANTNFEFEIDDRSPNVAIDSEQAGTIKASLTTKMKEADYLLVIVGKKSSTSKWMAWEIARAKQSDVKLRLAAVKINSTNTPPARILNTATAWAYSFTRDGIVDALNKARNDY
jgi:NAD(P)H-flavin reductase